MEKVAREALYIKGKHKDKKKRNKDSKEEDDEEEEDNTCSLLVRSAAYVCEGACTKLSLGKTYLCIGAVTLAKDAGLKCCKSGGYNCAKKVYSKVEKYFFDIGYSLHDELDPHDIENFNKYYRTGKPQDHARLNRYDLDIAIGQRVVNPDKVFKTLPIVTEEDSKFE